MNPRRPFVFQVVKIALRFSLVSNLGLLICLGILWSSTRHEVRKESNEAAASLSSQPALPRGDHGSALPHPDRVQNQPFHWSQIESSDYRTYVANLHAIGCPEQTIRDIITSDVSATFASRRIELEQAQRAPELAGIDRSMPWSQGEALARLRDEEIQVIELLLGPQAASPAADARRLSPAQAARRRQLQMRPAVMPLVLQDVDTASLQLDENRIQVIRDLRQEFLNQIGSPNQDPSDPAYRERWLRAQAESDELLRGMIGLRAYQEYELQASAHPPDGVP